MKKLFYLLIATIVLISCGNGSKNKTETSEATKCQVIPFRKNTASKT